MMSFLSHWNPGETVTWAILAAIVQSSIVVLLAAGVAGVAFKGRAAARHAIWLGVLIWVLLSLVVAVQLAPFLGCIVMGCIAAAGTSGHKWLSRTR